VWDLLPSSVDVFCAVWRKGLRRIWNLPHNTHCALLPLLCGLLPLMDKLACRCAKFICSCLYSESDVAKFIARHGVYFRKMLSPVGCNSLFCCSRFGVHLSDIVSINKSCVRARYHSRLSPSLYRTVYVLLELLFVRFGYFSVSCLSHADIVYAINYICTFLVVISGLLYLYSCA